MKKANKKASPVGVDVLEQELPTKFLMTILVLSVSLVRAVSGGDPGILSKEAGAKVVAFMQESITATFPEIAPMIMGLLGLELIQLMPVLKNPEILIRNMVKNFQYAGPIPQPNTE